MEAHAFRAPFTFSHWLLNLRPIVSCPDAGSLPPAAWVFPNQRGQTDGGWEACSIAISAMQDRISGHDRTGHIAPPKAAAVIELVPHRAPSSAPTPPARPRTPARARQVGKAKVSSGIAIDNLTDPDTGPAGNLPTPDFVFPFFAIRFRLPEAARSIVYTENIMEVAGVEIGLAVSDLPIPQRLRVKRAWCPKSVRHRAARKGRK